jgi:acetoin utilization deacetylase AcuC-like enzyme
MGFCLFNNAAVAAAHATDVLGLDRVLIFDPDVHHGNGTQHIFARRSDVTYVSIHQFPFYPGTGDVTEMGDGPGLGATINFPLRAGAGDGDYDYVMRAGVVPIIDEIRPQMVLVSAGFDAHQLDPLGGMTLSTTGFVRLFGQLHAAARRCSAPVVYLLEGGYSLTALAEVVPALLRALVNDAWPTPQPDFHVRPDVRGVVEYVTMARRRLSA